jgi:hypothetical protein
MKGEDYKLIKENWDKFLKEEEQLDEITQFMPGGMSTIVNMGTQTPEVVRRWLANAKAEGAIPSWLKPYADKSLGALDHLKNDPSWKLLIWVLKAASWLSDPLGQKIWSSQLTPRLNKLLDAEFPELKQFPLADKSHTDEALAQVQKILKQSARKDNEEK